MTSLHDSHDRLWKRLGRRKKPKAVLRALSLQPDHATEISVEAVRARIERDGEHMSRRDITAVMRVLEEEGHGKLVIGRRGSHTRFVSPAGVSRIGRLALGMPLDVSASDDSGGSPSGTTTVHRIRIRPNVEATLELPEDVDAPDLNQIAQFVLRLQQRDSDAAETQSSTAIASDRRPPSGDIRQSALTSTETVDGERRLRLGVALVFRFPAIEIDVPRHDVEGELETEIFLETAEREGNPKELKICRIDPYVDGYSAGRLWFFDTDGVQVRVRRSPGSTARTNRKRRTLLAEANLHLHRYLDHSCLGRELGVLIPKLSLSGYSAAVGDSKTLPEVYGL